MRAVALAWALTCVAATSSLAQDGAKMTVEEVERSWKEREAVFRAAEIEWTEEYHLPKGSRSRQWERLGHPAMMKRMNPEGAIIPATDSTFEVKGRLWLLGGQIMLERDEPDWIPSEKTFARAPVRHLYDLAASITRTLQPDGRGDFKYSQATVIKEAVFRPAGDPHFRPLCVALRPISPHLRTVPTADLFVTGRRQAIQGVLCEEVQWVGGKAGPLATFWIDASKGHVIARATIHNRGKVVQQIDTTFAQRPSGHWVPQTWRVTINDPEGRLSTTSSATVTRWTDSTDVEFKLTFPPGTLSYDNALPKDERFHITRKDGGRFPIGSEDRAGRPYEELLEEMNAEDARGLRLRRVVLSILALALASTCLAIGWRFVR